MQRQCQECQNFHFNQPRINLVIANQSECYSQELSHVSRRNMEKKEIRITGSFKSREIAIIMNQWKTQSVLSSVDRFSKLQQSNKPIFKVGSLTESTRKIIKSCQCPSRQYSIVID